MALLAAETKRDDLIKSLSGQAADQVSFDADLRQYRKRLEEQTAQLATLGDQLAEEERRKQALEKDLAAVSASLAAEQSLRADAEVQLRYVGGSVGACACACRQTCSYGARLRVLRAALRRSVSDPQGGPESAGRSDDQRGQAAGCRRQARQRFDPLFLRLRGRISLAHYMRVPSLRIAMRRGRRAERGAAPPADECRGGCGCAGRPAKSQGGSGGPQGHARAASVSTAEPGGQGPGEQRGPGGQDHDP